MFGELNQCTIQLLSRKGGSEIIPTRIKHAYFSVRCTTQQCPHAAKCKQLLINKFQVSQKMVSFSEPSVNQALAAGFKMCKAFQDRLSFLNRHMVVWIGWDSSISQIYLTAGHLVF